MSQPPLQKRVPISQVAHITMACYHGRRLAAQAGFDNEAQAAIVTAILEVGHNIVKYAQRGEINITVVDSPDERRGLRILAQDTGPGIADIGLALQDGYSSGQGLGLGLPGARRLMDDFQIDSTPGQGTTILMTKWTGQ